MSSKREYFKYKSATNSTIEAILDRFPSTSAKIDATMKETSFDRALFGLTAGKLAVKFQATMQGHMITVTPVFKDQCPQGVILVITCSDATLTVRALYSLMVNGLRYATIIEGLAEQSSKSDEDYAF